MASAEATCVQCQETPATGWVSNGELFCSRCWTCLICGGWCETPRRFTGRDIQFCSRCVVTRHHLGPEEIDLLNAIDAVRPTFSIWHRSSRREDSGGIKNLSPPVEQPSEVRFGIFLGDLDDARDIPRLKNLNVGAVLCLCQDRLDTKGPDGRSTLENELQVAGIHFLSLRAEDTRKFDIVSETMPSAFEFIEEQLRHGRRVLVHCWGGVNRCAAVVVGFLILRRGIPLVTAVETAIRARGTVLTNRHFRLLLVRAALGSSFATTRSLSTSGSWKRNWTDEMFSGGVSRSGVWHSISKVCCKRRIAADERVRSIICGTGHVVHGLCFEFTNGGRRGIFLENDMSKIDIYDDRALQRRHATWQHLDANEFIIEVSGHGSRRPFLAADVVMTTSHGRKFSFRGGTWYFDQNRMAPFKHAVRPGHAIVEVLFDQEQHTCSGIRDVPVSSPTDPRFVNLSALTLHTFGEGSIPRTDVSMPRTSDTSSRWVQWIVGGVGHVVHGLVLVFTDGTRQGIFLEDDRTEIDLEDDSALRRRRAKWRMLAPDEYIIAISGHRSKRRYLAANLVFRTSAGRQFNFCGPQEHFEWNRLEAFAHEARPGHAIIAVSFDLEKSTCSDINDVPVPKSFDAV